MYAAQRATPEQRATPCTAPAAVLSGPSVARLLHFSRLCMFEWIDVAPSAASRLFFPLARAVP